MGRHLLAIALTLVLFAPSRARAENAMREFVMSCSYGAMAGTLVGAATLAFTDHPGDNLNKIARGASLGLYAGMLLGAYVVWGVSDDSQSADEAELGSSGWGPERPHPMRIAKGEPVRLSVWPLLGEKGLEGATVRYSVLRF